MAEFRASKRMTKLRYNFEDFAPEHLRPMEGVIDEPSRQAVIDFNAALARGLEAVNMAPDDPTDRAAVMRQYDKLTTEQLYRIDDHVLTAMCDLTNNNPPRDQLEQVGSRGQMVFREWLQNECNRPEAPTPAT